MIKLPSRNAIIANGAVLSFIAFGMVTLARATFAPNEAPVCSERYPSTLTLALERDGEPMRIAEFQADLNGQEYGLMENVTIRPLQEGPAKSAMAVKLDRGTGVERVERDPSGGMALSWKPQRFRDKRYACLSYSLYLPANFDFAAGGTLPGLMGGVVNADGDTNSTFAYRLLWTRDGRIVGSDVRSVDGVRKTEMVKGRERASQLPRGRWVRIEQEVILNSDNMRNATFRVWIDKALAHEKIGFVTGLPKNAEFQGVAANVHFGSEVTESTAKSDTKLFITPIQLRVE